MGRRADEKGNSTSRNQPNWTASKTLGNARLLDWVDSQLRKTRQVVWSRLGRVW